MSHDEDNSASSILRALMIKEATKDSVAASYTKKVNVPNSLFLSIDRKIHPSDKEDKSGIYPSEIHEQPEEEMAPEPKRTGRFGTRLGPMSSLG